MSFSHKLSFPYLPLIIFSVSLFFGGCSHKKPGAKPNIIFILADDIGWADLPAYGKKLMKLRISTGWPTKDYSL